MSNYMKDMEAQRDSDVKAIKEPHQLKMYILVKDSVPIGLAMAAVAHAAVACFDNFAFEPEMTAWFRKSFKKVVCKVNDEQLFLSKEYDRHVIMTESSWGGQETSIAFCPRVEWDDFFNKLELYS